MRRQHYGSKGPTKAQQRVALKTLLIMREKPLTDADVASLARSYGTTAEAVLQALASVRAERAGRNSQTTNGQKASPGELI